MKQANESKTIFHHNHEIIIMIFIIVIFASIAIPSWKSYRDIESTINAVRTVQNKIDTFSLEYKRLPESLEVVFQQKIPEFKNIKNIYWDPSGTLTILFDERIYSRMSTDKQENTLKLNAEVYNSKIKWRCADCTLTQKYKDKLYDRNK